jgi:hypothetical protein
MSVNSKADGSGTVYTGAYFRAVIQSWDSATVNINFYNDTGVYKYVSNAGQGIPFIRIMGYPIRQATAYESFRDISSVAKRQERALTTKSDWIQHRQVALEHAGKMVTAASRPRPEIAVTVMGDPRRSPGQLASIADAEGTRAEGTWRILSVDHHGNGAQYTQDLKLVGVSPVGYWDVDVWDDSVWGE